MTIVRFCDEQDNAFGWIHPNPDWMFRAGHAIRSGGRVWVIDPPSGEGVAQRVVKLGVPGGVIQLLDRHERDCAKFAATLGVPHHVVPFEGVPGAPFEVVPVVNVPGWREVALWFPVEQTLVCADVLTAAPGYTARRERVGVHPLLRVRPATHLAAFPTEHLLLAHGEGVHGPEARVAVQEALASARRNMPVLALDQIRRVLRR